MGRLAPGCARILLSPTALPVRSALALALFASLAVSASAQDRGLTALLDVAAADVGVGTRFGVGYRLGPHVPAVRGTALSGRTVVGDQVTEETQLAEAALVYGLRLDAGGSTSLTISAGPSILYRRLSPVDEQLQSVSDTGVGLAVELGVAVEVAPTVGFGVEGFGTFNGVQRLVGLGAGVRFRV